MCDCYGHKCEKCDTTLDIHLGDYDTGREEIEVYCDEHIPLDTDNGVVWQWSDDEGKKPTDMKRMFIKWRTKNAEENADDNCPNTWHAVKEAK